MKHQDLGVIDGPMLLFGGPYSNLQALAALFGQAKRLGIPADRMVCTGDVVAYCGDPVATVDMMRASGVPVVAGNCEQQLAAGALDCGCGFDQGSACDILSVGWFGYAHGQVTAAHRRWMGQTADIISFRHAGQRYGVVHGGCTDVARFIWPASASDVFAQEWSAIEDQIGKIDHVIAGHCGVPFIRDTGRGSWINAGVIGMPPNDGADSTRFVVLDQGQARICTLQYDVSGAVAAMDRAGLHQGYEKALGSGYWPSEDILPLELRRASLASG